MEQQGHKGFGEQLVPGNSVDAGSHSLRVETISGATAQTETNRRCRSSSATGCLEVGIKRAEGIKNEDILTGLLLNYLSIGSTKSHLLHQVAVKVK